MTYCNFHVLIPARYNSTRLPGKLLMKIGKYTLLQRVYEQALKAKPKSITIATDSELIAIHAKEFGAKVEITGTHATGTDRIAEVVRRSDSIPQDDIIVNVQGDEPFIAPELIKQVACNLHEASNISSLVVSTLCWPLEKIEQLTNKNVVKVVRDINNNALYFSRSSIPGFRDVIPSISTIFRHIGIYAYKMHFLKEFGNLPVSTMERYELLEQLRILYSGYKIRVELACVAPLQDVNTIEDLKLAIRAVTHLA